MLVFSSWAGIRDGCDNVGAVEFVVWEGDFSLDKRLFAAQIQATSSDKPIAPVQIVRTISKGATKITLGNHIGQALSSNCDWASWVDPKLLCSRGGSVNLFICPLFLRVFELSVLLCLPRRFVCFRKYVLDHLLV